MMSSDQKSTMIEKLIDFTKDKMNRIDVLKDEISKLEKSIEGIDIDQLEKEMWHLKTHPEEEVRKEVVEPIEASKAEEKPTIRLDPMFFGRMK